MIADQADMIRIDHGDDDDRPGMDNNLPSDRGLIGAGLDEVFDNVKSGGR